MELVFGCLVGMGIFTLVLFPFADSDPDFFINKESYFNGSVIVTYTWHPEKGKGNDEILFEFLSPIPAMYHVVLANSDDLDDREFLPDDFFVEMNNDAPQKRLISHPEITKNITVTITINNSSEEHDL